MELFKNLKLRYLIVANDAGAAYQIFFLIKKFHLKCYYFLRGPAKNIFNQKNVESFNEGLKKCDVVITGTSLKTDLEIKAIKNCKLKSKTVISIFDNFNNFKKRFTLNKKIYYPDILITLDNLSYKEAKKYNARNFRLLKIKDYYLEYVHKIKQKIKKKNIIYFTSNYDRVSQKPIDLILLESFCYKMKKLKLKLKKGKREIYIKLHPSENPIKYHSAEFFKRFKIKIIKETNILRILKNFDIAGGCETYALALSQAFGLKTFNNIKNFNIKPKLGNLYKIKEI